MKRHELRSIISEIVRSVIYEESIKLPTGKWVKATNKSLEAFRKELFDMIQSSYAPIGGHHDFKSPSDINNNDADFWEFVDVDGDENPDALAAAKTTRFGKKSVVGATNGTSAAKRASITHRVSRLKKPGSYAEVSDKLADIIMSMGVPVVNNEDEVRKVLNKDIQWIGKIPGRQGDGWYSRMLGGSRKNKILVGRPKI